MTERRRKTLWQFPWLYRESMIFIAGLILVGYALQFSVGPFNFLLLRYPVNMIVAAVLVLLLIGGFFLRSNPFIVWLSGVPFAVTLLGAFLLLGLIMGLTPQDTLLPVQPDAQQTSPPVWHALGWARMTASWPFVFIYFLLLLSLGLLVARRLAHPQIAQWAFYCNHVGLWFVLLVAGLGYADIGRYVMLVRKGELQWSGKNHAQESFELPLAIRLNDFTIDFFPPKLVVIDRVTATPQPPSRPVFYQINPDAPDGRLPGWTVHVETYLEKAARNSSNTYSAWPMEGAVPAALVTARNSDNTQQRTGWVSSGNMSQFYMRLPLDENYSLAMAQPEPKRFASDITVYTQDGQTVDAVLEVNKPLEIGHWTIYQYSYDTRAGTMSAYSSIELVYDPWLYYVYAGFAVLALGCAGLIWTGRKKTEGGV